MAPPRLKPKATALRWRASASRLLPRRALRLPYAAALRALQLAVPPVAAPARARVWARNSWLTPQFRPLASDLDVTVWLEGEPGTAQRAQLASLLAGARRALPWLGEANVYERGEARLLAPHANRFEIGRDPRLAEILGLRAEPGREGPRSPWSEPAQATTFLLRMLEADIVSVRDRPERRRAKWEGYFARAGCGAAARVRGETLLDRILETALSLSLAPADRAEAAAQCRDYLARAADGWEPEGLDFPPWWFVCFPNRICWAEPPRPLPGGAAGLEIFRAQVSWEIWGLSAQHRLSPIRAELGAHAAKLARLVERAEPAPEAREFLTAGLEQLVSACARG
jgi:hypothetical protein